MEKRIEKKNKYIEFFMFWKSNAYCLKKLKIHYYKNLKFQGNHCIKPKTFYLSWKNAQIDKAIEYMLKNAHKTIKCKTQQNNLIEIRQNWSVRPVNINELTSSAKRK